MICGRRGGLTIKTLRTEATMIAIHANDVVAEPVSRAKKALWAGRGLSGLAVLFLLFDATVKVLRLPLAMEATAQLGYPQTVIFGLGVVELACLVVYVVPATSVLGAVLWTGYLGVAIATHVRVGSPLFTH